MNDSEGGAVSRTLPNPLRLPASFRTFPTVDDERDVEVFERIPWESLEGKPDRRWLAYTVAGVLVLGAVGVSIGRQVSPAPGPPITTLPAAVTATEAPVASPPPTTAITAPAVTTWTEADLMALPAESVQTAAMATAEWYVVDYFTRDDPGGPRSFVEWARASEITWESPSEAWVKVLVRRLAADDGEDYRRLETEAWRVGMRLDDAGWSVLPTPMRMEAPVLAPLEESGSSSTADWVDGAGVTWRVREAESP